MKVIFLALAVLLPAASVPAAATDYRIGVLANRGKEECLRRWTPTARALSRRVPGGRFVVVPLDYAEVDAAVREGRIDFLVTNPAMYVRFEVLYRIQPVATLKSVSLGHGTAVYGTTVFVRADNASIRGWPDLRGKRLMAPDSDAFGGWLMAERELVAQGLDPRRGEVRVEFGGIQDAPVHAVLSGKADAGAVRTDLLETMALEGKLDLALLRVLPQPPVGSGLPEDFPLLNSTRLYPEWPFAKLRHTPRGLAEKTLVALLSIGPRDEAAVVGRYEGWTVPFNYQSVHDCLRELRYPPYEDYGKVTPSAALGAYWRQLLAAVLAVAGLAAFALRLRVLNLRLRQALSEVRTLSGMLPICASCKRIRDDKGYWNQIESYVRAHSSAEFTHGICPECVKRLYPDFKL